MSRSTRVSDPDDGLSSPVFPIDHAARPIILYLSSATNLLYLFIEIGIYSSNAYQSTILQLFVRVVQSVKRRSGDRKPKRSSPIGTTQTRISRARKCGHRVDQGRPRSRNIPVETRTGWKTMFFAVSIFVEVRGTTIPFPRSPKTENPRKIHSDCNSLSVSCRLPLSPFRNLLSEDKDLSVFAEDA